MQAKKIIPKIAIVAFAVGGVLAGFFVRKAKKA